MMGECGMNKTISFITLKTSLQTKLKAKIKISSSVCSFNWTIQRNCKWHFNQRDLCWIINCIFSHMIDCLFVINKARLIHITNVIPENMYKEIRNHVISQEIYFVPEAQTNLDAWGFRIREYSRWIATILINLISGCSTFEGSKFFCASERDSLFEIPRLQIFLYTLYTRNELRNWYLTTHVKGIPLKIFKKARTYVIAL